MSKRVIIDPIACDGHGICAELLPERIVLDEWGYAIVDDEPMSGEVLAHARRAVAACPTLALALARAEHRHLASGTERTKTATVRTRRR